ncbi:hypothetical protein F5Y11DRAFT_9495 [Daldinia sp. FL1419]|nr:hypothetical protein F5Y11DRAFT_9495 [Daldinia sp. FL1419]
MSSKLRAFGRKISGNRRKNQEFTPEARAFMVGAVAGGATKTAVADAFNCKRQTVTQQVERFEHDHLFRSRRRRAKDRIIQGRRSSRLRHLVRRQPRIRQWY